jgi:hypothetical protein
LREILAALIVVIGDVRDVRPWGDINEMWAFPTRFRSVGAEDDNAGEYDEAHSAQEDGNGLE